MSPETERVRSARRLEAPGVVAHTGYFLLQFLELQIPMGLGALICYLVGRLIPPSSSFATVYHPGTYLFAIGDVLFLTVPVMAWIILRGHSWRYSLEMAVAMNTPVAAIIVFGQLAGSAYLLWLVIAMYPAMCLGMLTYMLYRRDIYTEWVSNPAHIASSGGEDKKHLG